MTLKPVLNSVIMALNYALKHKWKSIVAENHA